MADENGTRKLTRDEELSTLDAAYKKTVDNLSQLLMSVKI